MNIKEKIAPLIVLGVLLVTALLPKNNNAVESDSKEQIRDDKSAILRVLSDVVGRVDRLDQSVDITLVKQVLVLEEAVKELYRYSDAPSALTLFIQNEEAQLVRRYASGVSSIEHDFKNRFPVHEEMSLAVSPRNKNVYYVAGPTGIYKYDAQTDVLTTVKEESVFYREEMLVAGSRIYIGENCVLGGDCRVFELNPATDAIRFVGSVEVPAQGRISFLRNRSTPGSLGFARVDADAGYAYYGVGSMRLSDGLVSEKLEEHHYTPCGPEWQIEECTEEILEENEGLEQFQQEQELFLGTPPTRIISCNGVEIALPASEKFVGCL